MKLNVKAFAVTCGLVWGLAVFCFAWWVMIFEGAGGSAGMLGHIYRGFAITPMGSVIGLFWALGDGFIGGLIFAWLYNRLCDRFK